MDFKLFINAFLSGTPIAILIALVGIVWQGIYTRSRDKTHDEQIKREIELEEQKFKHQEKIEEFKFKFEQLRGREQLAHDITLKHLDIKLLEYEKIWSLASGVSLSNQDAGKVTPEITKNIASKVQDWRYSQGGLVADEPTRSVSYYFQRALWEYDGSKDSFLRIRHSRDLLRDAVRADIGLGERQKVIDELSKLQATFDSAKQKPG